MKKIIFWFLLISTPFVCWWLYEAVSWGLIPFFIQQIYYLPLSWLGEPFFISDSEVGFWVSGLGRALGVIIYSAIYWGIWYAFIKYISANNSFKFARKKRGPDAAHKTRSAP